MLTRRKRAMWRAVWGSLLVGALGALTILAVEVKERNESSRPRPLGPQIEWALARAADPIQSSISKLLGEDYETYKARQRQCEQRIDSLGLRTEEARSLASREVIVALADAPCFISDQPILDEIDWDEIAGAWIVVTLIALFSTAALTYVWTYPHTGWRRLSTVLGLVAGIGVGLFVMFDLEDVPEIIVAATVAALVASLLVLVARDAVLWVRLGFRPTNPGADTPVE